MLFHEYIIVMYAIQTIMILNMFTGRNRKYQFKKRCMSFASLLICIEQCASLNYNCSGGESICSYFNSGVAIRI